MMEMAMEMMEMDDGDRNGDVGYGEDRFSEVVEDSPSMEADVVGRN